MQHFAGWREAAAVPGGFETRPSDCARVLAHQQAIAGRRANGRRSVRIGKTNSFFRDAVNAGVAYFRGAVAADAAIPQIIHNDQNDIGFFDRLFFSPARSWNAGFFLRGGLSSRFSWRRESLTAGDGQPSFGTSTLAVQRIAFNTTLRKFSSCQLTCLWAPVKPKPRPPLGRS